ncbi:MAG: glycosyltransferase family 4 protein [Acidobacteriota bacterium]
MKLRGARVCIVAENASTRLGGEAILPFHYFRLLRDRGVDAHLIVHERVRAELEEAFAKDRERLHFVEDQTLQKIFFRMSEWLPRRVAEATLGLANQMLTQMAQRKVIRALAKEAMVVHQPIPVSPRFPSMMWDLDAPVVMGPLNGAMEYPAAFRGSESWMSRCAIALGRSLSDAVNELLPGKRNAAVVLVANERTRKALPSGLLGGVLELVENGVDLAQWSGESAPMEDDSKRFVFVGRLVDWKALDVAIEAVRAVDGASLEVIGDGPMLDAWRKFAVDAGVAERVKFSGWKAQAECAVRLRGACALVLPSIYECGGAVVLEAMACAKPVIATAWGGPIDYLDASCGVLVEPSSREALVKGFAVAMQRMIDEPELAAQMGRAGRTRVVERFDWEKKVDALMRVYESVLPVDIEVI